MTITITDITKAEYFQYTRKVVMFMAYRKGDEVFINANSRKPHFRALTDEEIEEIAEKDWKEQNHEHKDSSKNKRYKNLSGPKTLEGKKRALQNLRPAASKTDTQLKLTKHAGYLRELLNDSEREFYEERREKYIEDFELNESSDDSLLAMCLMEEVMYRRLMLYQAESPSKPIDRPLKECQDRLLKALKALGMTREQRQGQKVNVQHSISELAERVALEYKQDADKLAEQAKEEEELMRKRQERLNSSDVIDIEYEAVDDDEVDIDD